MLVANPGGIATYAEGDACLVDWRASFLRAEALGIPPFLIYVPRDAAPAPCPYGTLMRLTESEVQEHLALALEAERLEFGNRLGDNHPGGK